MNYPINAAEAILARLKAGGVDYLFANGGTDFAPVIEGLARGQLRGTPMPEVIIVPHESAAMAMAHGCYLATGRAQAVMVHVNVGLANCVMGAINAMSDNVPIVLMSGRTPLTEHDRFGARMTPVQYGQEMRDQTALVREAVKWDYELRYGEQAGAVADRALAVANSEPKGPVYLSLPREPLSEEPVELTAKTRQAAASSPAPDPTAIGRAADLLANADRPLILCQRGDPDGRLGAALADFADRQAMPVVEYWPVRNVLPSDHPMQAGYDFAGRVADADVILAIDAQVPWITRSEQPSARAKIIHAGPDPLFQRFPVRSFPADLNITGDPADVIVALAEEMANSDCAERHAEISAQNAVRRSDAEKTALAGDGPPMSPSYVSHHLGQLLGPEDLLVNEMGAVAAAMHIQNPNRFFMAPYSGGLGWGLPAALGMKLARRDRFVVACIGDGAYMFANPVACHQVAEALDLPILTIVMNNDVWNAVGRAARLLYPDGAAVQMNEMPITSLKPLPDFPAIAAASRGWGRRVTEPTDLPAALAEAKRVVVDDKRQALLEVAVGLS